MLMGEPRRAHTGGGGGGAGKEEREEKGQCRGWGLEERQGLLVGSFIGSFNINSGLLASINLKRFSPR